MLRSERDAAEFAELCKLLIKRNPGSITKVRHFQILDWHELRISFDGKLLAVKWRSDDGVFVSSNYLYNERVGTHSFEIREIRRHLPDLRKATLLDKLADV